MAKDKFEGTDVNRPYSCTVIGYLPNQPEKAILLKNGLGQVLFEEYWNGVINPEFQAKYLLEFAQDLYDYAYEKGEGHDV